MTSTPDELLAEIRKLYENSLDRHGVSSPGVGWPDETAHRLRFEKLASVIRSGIGAVTVNDLGTGYGAYSEFLLDLGVDVRLFRGYDISERMIERAREIVAGGEFHVGSSLDRHADYSFACGIFNVRLETDENSWQQHIERTLDNLNEFSTRGFAFNMLSTYVDYREPHLYYGDPLTYFDRCKRRYSRQVSLLHDYPLYEWTIMVRK